jgi:Leucine-rich repeat (LRR) protein
MLVVVSVIEMYFHERRVLDKWSLSPTVSPGEMFMRNMPLVNVAFLLFAIALSGCNSLQKEYAIVKEIQEEGHSTRMNDLTPEKIATSGFDSENDHIVKLDLSGQGLAALSSKIGKLRHLKRLELNGNKLTSLPIEIGNLIGLEYLSVADNSITSLPETFKNLTNLKTLFLYDNQLSNIPEYFSSFSQLEILSVMNNRIMKLDSRLTKLPKLSSLNVDSNYVCDTSASADITAWMEAHSGAQWRDHQNCK